MENLGELLLLQLTFLVVDETIDESVTVWVEPQRED